METEKSRKARKFNTLKELEAVEIEEEENYIANLKIQREKIEEYRQEINAKHRIIKELEQEVENLRSKKPEIEKLSSEVIFLTNELRESEIENSKLRSTISSQVNEYDQSIHELKQIVLREREEKAKEISYLRKELGNKEEDLETVMEALEHAKSDLTVQEKKYEHLKVSLKEKESIGLEQVKNLKNSEKSLKEEINLLRQENLSQKETIKVLSDRVNKQNSLQEEFETVRIALLEEKRKNKELRKDFYDSSERYESLKLNIENEFSGIKEELDQAIEIIKRQEISIQDLRQRKQEDDAKISNQGREIDNKHQDLLKLQKLNSKLTQSQDDLLDKISDLEHKIKVLVSDNTQMKNELEKIHEKQEQERDERKKMARKKLELLTQRNEEISRLNQVFSALDN